MKTEVDHAVCDILNYLLKHPASKHSAEGIAKYWIYQQRLETNLNQVIEAISYLLQEGFLEQVILSDGATYYKINESKRNEIPTFLKRINTLPKQER